MLGSISDRTDLARHGSRPTQLHIGSNRCRPTPIGLEIGEHPLDLTSAQGDSVGHGPGRLDSICVWTDSSRHGPGPTLLDMGPGRLGSTWAQCRLNLVWVPIWLGLWPTQLDLALGWLGSTLARNDLAQFWPIPTRFDLGPNVSARHGLGPTLLNLGPNCFDSTWISSQNQPKMQFG